MADKVRWGIMGTGRIAGKFAEGLRALLDAELVAVGSRAQATADTFAREHNVARRHASYEALVNDPAVDAIYVATPHSLHAENMLMSLAAGKPVLCEKPFTINARQAEVIIQTARASRLLVMEAMWTRFLPLMMRLKEMLARGTIGEVHSLKADFGFKTKSRQGRLFNPALGGGALLDVGIYPVSLASMIFGPPTKVTGTAELGPTGVDEHAVIALSHAQGQQALLEAALNIATLQEATIIGTLGKIKLHPPWWKGSDLTLYLNEGGEEFFEFPFTGNGYQFEAAAFMDCLRQGKREHEIMPLDETLSIMKTLDALRAQWGLKYPME